MGVVVNADAFCAGLDKTYKDFEESFRFRMRRVMSEGMRRLCARTPVNTGAAIMSYVAGSGSPPSGGASSGFDPVEPTNDLALGQEKLRPVATQIAMATLANVSYSNPFTTYWIVNRAPHIEGLEYGMLPTEPYIPRSPHGMFGVTTQELLLLLSSGKI
jgi:hypothetical protein